MRKIIKRMLSIATAITMAVCLLPAQPALAIEGSEEDEAEEYVIDPPSVSADGRFGGVVRPFAASGNLVVVLDPGHDATHTGAAYGSLREETLNLEIAQYCKAELETYGGVTVYMTRSSAACSNGGGTTSACLTHRVDYAKSVGADVFVSLHINDTSGDVSERGAEVYYPNSYGNTGIHNVGSGLASSILSQLVSLGLYNRGTKTRTGSSGSDYYAVIRQSKNAGFPGLIVEHAFISNSTDRAYLNNEDGLKSLGVADATGIANYYGLKKGGASKVLGKTYYFKNSISDGDADAVIAYGKEDDEVLVGDWDGDGQDTLCVRRGQVYYFKNSIADGDADAVIAYGKEDDDVLVGDWNGDGQDTLAVRRGNAYYIKNSIADGDADTVVAYGKADDDVLAGDWNGSGQDTLAVRRGKVYYFKNSISDGEADAVIAYGREDDDVLAGDWNGSGQDTLAVRRGKVYYFKNSIGDGDADAVIAYGRETDYVLRGDWDGDRVDTLCVRR